MAKMGFRHIPSSINGKREMPSARDIERALRDAGCSSKQAETILAKGYSGNLRDEDEAEESIPAIDAQSNPKEHDNWIELYFKQKASY